LVWIGFVCLGSQTANNPGILLALIIFGALISLPPAYVIGSAFGRNPSVRAYLHSLVRPRGAWIYYLIAMFLPLILYWLGTQLSHLLDLPVYWSPIGLRGWRGAGTLALALGNQFIFANVLGEEVGWRGFALPRLQNRYSPLMASLVLAPLWFAWHLPLKLGNPDILPMLYYALSFLPSTLFLTWLYNRSQGSILVVGLAHVAGNLCGKYLFPISVGTLLVRFVLVVILIFIDQMWRKLSEHHPGVHRLFDEIEL
jgi:membrane protease YdiL (CAAX protease family)